MKSRIILCLALVLSGLLMLWAVERLICREMRPHAVERTSVEWTFPSGERLINQSHVLVPGGFIPAESVLLTNKLLLEWQDGDQEFVFSKSSYRSVNHHALSTDGDYYVVTAGATVYHRKKTSPPNQWRSWTLTTAPEIFHFVKNHLDAQASDSYTFETNDHTPPGAFTIKCNRLGVEQRIIVAAEGDLHYEVKNIRNEGRELVAVPFAPNPFAPKLVFSVTSDFGGWKFDERLTAIENNHQVGIQP
jgi:hypothetical protein